MNIPMVRRMPLVLFALIVVIFFGKYDACYPQVLTAGIKNGMNFSDIHGDFTSGKWQSKPGPVAGMFVEYSLNQIIGFQTGLDYSKLYYEFLAYQNSPDPYPYLESTYSFWPLTYPRPNVRKRDFSFFRIPLYLKFSTPTRLRFELAAGVFYSFLLNSEKEIVSKDYKNYYGTDSKNDFGFIFSAGFSYPVSDHVKLFLNGRYITGRKVFDEYQNAKNGASEITIGMGYSGFLKHKSLKHEIAFNDSSDAKVWIKYKGGLNVSWVGTNKHQDSYSPKPGSVAGISLGWLLADQFSLQADILFERKGYRMNDSSSVFYRKFPDESNFYMVDSRIDLDYLVIPLLLNIHAGKSVPVFINLGPYYGIKLNARCTGDALFENSSDFGYNLNRVNIYDNIEGLVRNSEWGWIMGGGVGIPVWGKYMLNIDFRYSVGFYNIYKKEEKSWLSGINDDVLHNQSLQLTAGFTVPLY